MTGRTDVVFATVLSALLAPPLVAQCVTYLTGVNSSSATSVGVTSSNSAIAVAISGAATIWNNCGSSGIPAVNANAAGSIAVTVVHIAGPSTRADGACGEGAPTTDASGRVTGGTITIWDSWGQNSTIVAPGTDCTAHFSGLIAHELGHVFGLGNSSSSCPTHLMGAGWQSLSTPHAEECSAVDTQWTTDGESGGSSDPDANRNCATLDNCSPLVLDLNGDGIHTTSTDDPVLFDIDATGTPKLISWTNPETDEGLLWVDLNHDRLVNDGHELFGIATLLADGSPAADGFTALRAYDAPLWGGNGDGAITVADKIWGRLLLWVDANHDGVSQPQEVGPVQQYGVTALHLDKRPSIRRATPAAISTGCAARTRDGWRGTARPNCSILR